MIRRLPVLVAVSAATLLAVATPALGISSIANDLSVSSAGRYVSSGERTSWTARATFGQYMFANPYTADFECLLNAEHFNAPSSTRVSGTSEYWRYVSYDSGTRGPAWRSYSGTFWVFQPRTVYNEFVATGKGTGASRGWERSALGQHHWSVSAGPTDYQYTYHY